MKKIAIFVLTSFMICCHAQTVQKFNLGFEKQNDGNLLSDGWIKWGNYVLSIDSLSNSGEKSGKITSTKNARFGSIAYRIPASYKGSSIKLEGYMKIKNVENGFAGLLLRVDGFGKALAFDNMQKQNISGTRDWQKYSIELNYPEEADNIYVAGILTGKGEAWFDDFELTIDGKSIQSLKETIRSANKANLDKEFDKGSKVELPELTTGLTDDLDLLGRVWGFLKYYHPEIARGNYNWDYELFRFMPGYLKESKTIIREELLLNWIKGLGEIEKCKKCKQTASDAFLKPDLKWIAASIKNDLLRNELLYIYENRNQGKHFYIRMSQGVGNPEFLNEDAYYNMSYPDDGFRLLAVFRYWNMINYFFPYKHLIDKDWNNTLKEYIPVFTKAQNELEYELAVIQIIGDVKDTHANLYGGNNKIEEWKGNYYAPVHVRFIEKKLVVTDYYNPELKSEAGFEIGDIITRINNREVDDIVSELSKYYPASNKPTRLRNISADMLRSQSTELKIEYIHDGAVRTKMLTLYPEDSLDRYYWYKKNDEKCYKLLNNNIGYVTLMSIKDTDIPEIRNGFKDTKGIIIDIRNYPSSFVPFALGSFFVSTSTPFVKFTKGNVNNPGEFTFTKELVIQKSEETYEGKLIVIVNEFSQSQAEYTAMAFRAANNTLVIGSTTAGADGNISSIPLPGGLSSVISGIGVYYPNGKETQRVGIVPDIVVKPTIEGIKNGKDELVEKAIELILKEHEKQK